MSKFFGICAAEPTFFVDMAPFGMAPPNPMNRGVACVGLKGKPRSNSLRFAQQNPRGFYMSLGSGSAECKELRYGLLWAEEKAMSTFLGLRAQNLRILRHGPPLGLAQANPGNCGVACFGMKRKRCQISLGFALQNPRVSDMAPLRLALPNPRNCGVACVGLKRMP